MAYSHSTEYPTGLFLFELTGISTLQAGNEVHTGWVQLANTTGGAVTVTVTVREKPQTDIGTTPAESVGQDRIWQYPIPAGLVVTIPSFASQNGVIFSAAGAGVYAQGAYFRA